uniref:Putative ovule protein n=1 Tax=Solanum chacoense TaxID=4108 RepID=A0A0V0I5M6_SOLCH
MNIIPAVYGVFEKLPENCDFILVEISLIKYGYGPNPERHILIELQPTLSFKNQFLCLVFIIPVPQVLWTV